MTTDNARWEAAAANTTDEQLAELPESTRTSIEFSRAGATHTAALFTDSTDDLELEVARSDDDAEPELRARYTAGMDIDDVLRSHGWTRTAPWEVTPSATSAPVKRIDRGGRPAIGPRVHVAFPEETLKRIDAHAAFADITRAEAIRYLVEIALDK